jgi:hypothetical protein
MRSVRGLPIRTPSSSGVAPYNLALVFAGLGQHEKALEWLEQALGDRDVHMTFLRDHKWDSMRANPQFERVLELVGLSANQTEILLNSNKKVEVHDSPGQARRSISWPK